MTPLRQELMIEPIGSKLVLHSRLSSNFLSYSLMILDLAISETSSLPPSTLQTEFFPNKHDPSDEPLITDGTV